MRRFGVATISTVLLSSLLSPQASAQSAPASNGSIGNEAISSAFPGSSGDLGSVINDLTELAKTGSAFNTNAPILAPLSSGFSPLSAGASSGPGGSVITPAMMGSTLLMSTMPVGSVAVGAQILSNLGSAAAVDSAVGSLTGTGTPAPAPNPDITKTEVTKREPVQDPAVPGRLEVWTVNSAAMQRAVEVEVYFPGGNEPAPLLYYLDGIDNYNPSGFRWLTSGPRRAHEQGFIAVAPTGATASNFTDWINDDPRLGRNKWETFLNEELPPLLEADDDLNFNGKRGVIGVSMGAGAALQLAASKPGTYDAAAGVSGCYSTVSDLGYATLRQDVETRGGNIDNMWGPRGSELWQQHNLPDHTDKLRGTKIFMSTATGAIGVEDARVHGSNPGVLLAGYALEAGTYECTHEMARALDNAGIDYDLHVRPTGLHTWETFTPSFDVALDSILPALK